MIKKTYSNINLTCTLQKSEELQESQCHVGVISKSPEGFRFEEDSASPTAYIFCMPAERS